MFQKIILHILSFLARTIIYIKKPTIIGITGTAGKTTLSHFVHTFLRAAYPDQTIYVSPYSYNGEYGLPLTILQAKSGGKNPFLWMYVLVRYVYVLCTRYPDYIVLEYGIDHPGEMDFLVSIVRPHICILGEITPNHIEQFGTYEAYRAEKLKIVPASRYVVAHESLRPYISQDAIFYGQGALSDIDTSHIQVYPTYTTCQVHVYDDTYTDIMVPLSGAHQVTNVLPLFAIAHIQHIAVDTVQGILPKLTVVPGRSSTLRGIHSSTIIDGSYNGGYQAICAGIDFVENFAHTHTNILFLGDMRELGPMTDSLHTALADYILARSASIPHVVLVGIQMQKTVYPLLVDIYGTRVYSTLSSVDGGQHIHQILDTVHTEKKNPALIYVKGSQNTIFLEEGIKQFLDTNIPDQKLCRQSEKWMKIKGE